METETIKKTALAILMVAIFATIIVVLPVKATLAIIFLAQLVILIAIGGTNLRLINFSKHEQGETEE